MGPTQNLSEHAGPATRTQDCMIRKRRFFPWSGYAMPENRRCGNRREPPISARVPVNSLAVAMITLAVFTAACGHKAKVPPPPTPSTQKTAAAKPAAPRATTSPKAPSPRDIVIKPAGKPVDDTQVKITLPAATTVSDPGPTIRIGLNTNAREVRISAPGDFFLQEKIPEAARQTIRGDFQLRLESETEETVAGYRVQVASLSKRENAEALGRKLSEAFALPVVVRDNPGAGTYPVRIGLFASREEAQAFAEGPLLQGGYSGSIIVRDTGVRSGNGKPRLALRGPEVFRLSTAGFLFQPAAPDSHLRLDGKPYRGWLDVTLNRSGSITIVNQLGMEEYLPGVVPAEMSPSTYPEVAALSAQAIAARTYALKNRGRFAADGFDLTADVRSQVYGGVSQEKDLSTTAVRGTFGLAVYYQGSLIDAMYSSTCGGRTEDFASVFDGAQVPYLRSVACTVENSGGPGNPEIVLEGTHDLDRPFFAEDGATANRSLELGRLLGLGVSNSPTSEDLMEMATPTDVQKWAAQASRILGKEPAGKVPELGKADRAGIVRYFGENLMGPAEIQRRISAADASYYMSNLKDGADVPEEARSSVALFLQSGWIHPYPDNSIRPREPMKRSDALALIVRMLESSYPQMLRSGQAEAPGAGGDSQEKSLVVKWGNKSQKFGLARDVRLFKISGGRSTSVDSLKIIGNEKLRFHLASSGLIDFLEVELNPTGASSDRFSPVASWKTSLTPSVIGEKLRPLTGDIGEIKDLKPYRLGNSGRAVQIQVIGSRKTVVLNGYKARNALGLRDTLFTIQHVDDPSGQVESFTFNGRGWGHGVGLCQVGAFGMARAGKSYEEILKTYYKGVELRRAY